MSDQASQVQPGCRVLMAGKTQLELTRHLVPLAFARGKVSVWQPGGNSHTFPWSHPHQDGRHRGSLQCWCWVPALGVGSGTAGTPDLMEPTPIWVSGLLPCCRLAAPLSCGHCVPHSAWAVGHGEVTNPRTPGLLFIYCHSPVGPRLSL